MIKAEIRFDDHKNPVITLIAKSKKDASLLGQLGAWLKQKGVQRTYHTKTELRVDIHALGMPLENFGNGEPLDKLYLMKIASDLDMMET